MNADEPSDSESEAHSAGSVDTPVGIAARAMETALERLAALPQRQIVEVLSGDLLQRLMEVIAPFYAEDRRQGELPYDYLFRHKYGLALLASLRLALTYNYSVEASVGGNRV